LTVIPPDDVSGLRRLKSVKFGTDVVSSTRMMCALRFLEKVLIVAKLVKKTPKIGQKCQFSRKHLVAPHIHRSSVYVVRLDSPHATSKSAELRGPRDILLLTLNMQSNSHLTCNSKMQFAQHRSFHLFIHNNFETMYCHIVKAFMQTDGVDYLDRTTSSTD